MNYCKLLLIVVVKSLQLSTGSEPQCTVFSQISPFNKSFISPHYEFSLSLKLLSKRRQQLPTIYKILLSRQFHMQHLMVNLLHWPLPFQDHFPLLKSPALCSLMYFLIPNISYKKKNGIAGCVKLVDWTFGHWPFDTNFQVTDILPRPRLSSSLSNHCVFISRILDTVSGGTSGFLISLL